MKTYTTVQGDTWDQIALKLFGSEFANAAIMVLNGPYLDVWRFEAGVELTVPEDASTTHSVADLPPWRRSDD